MAQNQYMDNEASTRSNRPKSENRIRYESKVDLICAQHGSLEEMRSRLGYSQKQMSELLLVDPSAWTRWVKEGESAPAHIYQALAWYFEGRGLTTASAPIVENQIEWKMADQTWAEEKTALLNEWRESQKKAVGVSDGWKLFLLLNSLGLAYVLFSLVFSS